MRFFINALPNIFIYSESDPKQRNAAELNWSSSGDGERGQIAVFNAFPFRFDSFY